MKVIYDVIGVTKGAKPSELVDQLSDDAQTIIFIIRNDNPAIQNTVDVTEQRRILQDILLDQRRCEGAQQSMVEFAFKY